MKKRVEICLLWVLALCGATVFTSNLLYAENDHESRLNVVFHSARGGLTNAQIYAMNADGSNEVRLTSDTANDTDPDISPNGKEIIFTSKNQTPNSKSNIFLRDRHGEVRNLTNSAANDGWARWSPDGRHIVFESDRDGGVYEIYVMNVGDSDDSPRQLTFPPVLGRYPSWSPDGRYIVFRHGNDIAAVNADGGTPEQLTHEAPTSFAQMPAWSPDGIYLAFMSFRNGYCSVFRMDYNGNDQTELTPKNPADPPKAWCSRAPSWSTDGGQILFMSVRPSVGTQSQIFVMNFDGSDLRQLTDTGVNGSPRARLDRDEDRK